MDLRHMTLCALGFALVLGAVSVPGLALAQNDEDLGFRGWGPRVGLSAGPDQVNLGVHVDMGEFAEQWRFRPNFEMGFGDDMTLGSFNFDVQYRFSDRWNAWVPYVGGGPGLNFVSRDRGSDDTDVGLSGLFGVEKGIGAGTRFFADARLGIIDSPDFKLTTGWIFYD